MATRGGFVASATLLLGASVAAASIFFGSGPSSGGAATSLIEVVKGAVDEFSPFQPIAAVDPATSGKLSGPRLDAELAGILRREGFAGDLQTQLTRKLGRPIDNELASLGQDLFFDKVLALGNDNTCGSCHAPQAGFADSQSIAIGIDSNDVVGRGRDGPHNQRRSPSIINTAFYPSMMWNGRFFAPTGDPFDNSQGFVFPAPEGTAAFPANDPVIKTLLIAQAHIPPTEKPEMAGFGTERNDFFRSSRLGGRLLMIDNGVERSPLTQATSPAAEAARLAAFAARGSAVLGQGRSDRHGGGSDGPDPLPPPDPDGDQNDPIRRAVVARLQASPAMRQAFAKAFASVRRGGPIEYTMIARALAEFQTAMTFADAPIDQFARGDIRAMSGAQKRGALLFFGKARCSSCHAVAGKSNQLFSDFAMHNIAVPQIAPRNGKGNVEFAGPRHDQDVGLADLTCGAEAGCNDRFKFRSSPLRNLALQPTFMHNGAFTSLEDAVRHHLDVRRSVAGYDPERAGLKSTLTDPSRMADMRPVLAGLDPLLADPIKLRDRDVDDLVAFVRGGLTDRRVNRREMCAKIPRRVASGRKVPRFEEC